VALLAVGWPLHLYRNRYVVGTFDEVLILGFTWVLSGAIASVVNAVLSSQQVPTSIIAMAMMLAGTWMVMSRVIWRLYRTAGSFPLASLTMTFANATV